MALSSDLDTSSRQCIEELARKHSKLFVRHDFDHSGSGFTRDAISMTLDPTRAVGRKENSLELSHSKVSDFTGKVWIQRSMQSLSDLIFNELRPRNISERQSSQCAPCVSAHVIIARPAHIQITLFKLVGEHKYFAKPVASHRESF